jgi:RNA polymerase sigma factor (sigma-70 family)
MTATDLDLLEQFVRNHSQDAFTELVNRHVNLVYSAALRQVRSVQFAEEIAQSVFADLAHSAGKLNPGTTLSAWLYQVTRRTAIDVVRKEIRRQMREQIALEMNNINATSQEWTQIEPLLDEAMDALDETDRSAILLRFFENKNLRQVGERLNISDDAAQKRVSRAVARLQEFFTKRNVTLGASGLTVMISANAVQSAPVGLAATISAAAFLTGTAVSTAKVIATSKTIAMTSLQKAIISATLITTISAGVFEAQKAEHWHAQSQTLQQQQSPLVAKIQELQEELAEATNRLSALVAENENGRSSSNELELLKLRGEVASLRRSENDPLTLAANNLVAKVNKLKRRLEETPNAKIPELQFLTEKDWLDAAEANLNTDLDYRRALSSLRNSAENEFVNVLKPALDKYIQANNGQFPTDLSQLQEYFSSPVDDAILQRWEITSPKTVPNVGVGEDGIITEKAPVDDIFDSRNVVGNRGSGRVDFLTTETQDVLTPVYKAFTAANEGQEPVNMSQMLPYATTAEQQVALQKMIERQALDN